MHSEQSTSIQVNILLPHVSLSTCDYAIKIKWSIEIVRWLVFIKIIYNIIY